MSPSSAVAGPVTLTVGATFATATVCVARLPVAPSESVAHAETTELLGPSGNVHLNEPLVFVFVSEPATLTPLAPQDVATDETVSAPGSLIV